MSTITLTGSYNTEGRAGIGPLSQADADAICPLGTRLNFKTPSGEVEAVYLQADSSGVTAGNICVFDNYVATKAASTANQARGACVACATLAASEYGWFIVNGLASMLCDANNTADNGKAYLSSNAGVASASAANGKQIMGVGFAEAVTISSGTAMVKTNLQHPTLQGQTA